VTFPPLPQSKLIFDQATPEGCKAELTWLACYISRWHIRPKTVTHSSTNRTRRALTSFMRLTALTTTPGRQPSARLSVPSIDTTLPCNQLQTCTDSRTLNKSASILLGSRHWRWPRPDELCGRQLSIDIDAYYACRGRYRTTGQTDRRTGGNATVIDAYTAYYTASVNNATMPGGLQSGPKRWAADSWP